MKQPLWIINSSLLFLLLFVSLFIFFSRDTIIPRGTIKPESTLIEIKTERPSISIKKIYEKDLFDTYIVFPTEKGIGDVNLTLPQAPRALPPIIPALPKPIFLPPLNITLKGTVTISYDDSKNRAIIADNKTSQEGTYKVGDILEDAQLMRIFSNKVILVRSNGQQEILYLREKDAQNDPTFASLGSWTEIINEQHPEEFTIDPEQFTDRIKGLAQFIDMLDLTTVYKKGINIGCRIGTLEKDSFGMALGLRSGDIITDINSIPATDTAHRLKIYKDLTAESIEGKKIIVHYLRSKQPMTLKISLEAKRPKPTLEDIKKVPAQPQTTETVREKELRTLQEKYNFAPTLKEIRDRERKNMVSNGTRKPSIVE